MKRLFVLSMTFLFAVYIFTGCNFATKRIGWVCTDDVSTLGCCYKTFDGKKAESMKLNAGETLIISDEIIVNKGTLSVKLINSQKEEVWREEFLASAQVISNIKIEDDGFYKLIIQGEETGGSFLINWEIK